MEEFVKEETLLNLGLDHLHSSNMYVLLQVIMRGLSSLIARNGTTEAGFGIAGGS
jgi:hypothetical protein